jgi:hypothetical protein
VSLPAAKVRSPPAPHARPWPARRAHNVLPHVTGLLFDDRRVALLALRVGPLLLNLSSRWRRESLGDESGRDHGGSENKRSGDMAKFKLESLNLDDLLE